MKYAAIVITLLAWIALPVRAADGMAAEQLWLQIHIEIMNLSSDSQLHVVPGASHIVHSDRPDAVINAVTDMVLKIRGSAN